MNTSYESGALVSSSASANNSKEIRNVDNNNIVINKVENKPNLTCKTIPQG
jgi:hypothetical protein